MIDEGNRIKTMSDVNPVVKTSKNQHSFLEISPEQKEVVLSHKL